MPVAPDRQALIGGEAVKCSHEEIKACLVVDGSPEDMKQVGHERMVLTGLGAVPRLGGGVVAVRAQLC